MKTGENAKSEARSIRDRGFDAWVGLFVLAGAVAILVVLFTMTNPALFRGRYTVITRVADAGGIRRGDPVELKGVNVGRVSNLKIGAAGSEVEIDLELEKEYRVPRDSELLVASRGLLGDMVARMIPGQSAQPLRNGDVIAGAVEEKPNNAALRIAGESEQVLGRVQALLSDQTVHGIEASSTELAELLRSLTATVRDERGELSRVSSTLRRSADDIARITSAPELMESVQALDATATRIERMTPALERAVNSVDRSSHSMEIVLGRIEHGEGTIGRLSKDPALYDNANHAMLEAGRAARDVEKLTADVREHPRKYVNLSLF